MTLTLNASNAYLSGTIDLTDTPQLLLTNSSTYTVASTLSAVTAEEVSGNGYARPTLTVQSNSITPGGDSTLIYNLATITASGGAITFDRAVLVADGDWVGYWDYGSTQTIADGTTKPFRGITVTRSDSGTLVNGQNGDPAYSNTTASFVQPVVGGSVTIAMGQTNFLATGSTILVNDGSNRGTYEVTAVGSPTSITVERLEQDGSAPDSSTIASGALVVVSGGNGQNGTNGFGLPYTFSATTTAPPSSGELRLNNASPGSATAIYISETDRNSTNLASILNSLLAGSQLLITDESDPTGWALYTLNSLTDSGTYSTIAVTAVGSAGTLSGNISVSFALKGSTGATGATGGAGANGVSGFGLKFNWSATTTSPPSSGEVRLNNADYSLATAIYISETDRNSDGVAAVLATLSVGSSVMILDESDSTAYAIYTVTSNTDNGTDVTLGVTYIASGTSSFSGGVSFAFAVKGNTGSTGATGAAGTTGFGLEYTFSSTTSSPPSSGELRFNNASPSSATNIYVSETDRNTNNVASVLSSLSVGSFLLVRDENDNNAYALYSLSSNTDNGTDVTLGVTSIATGAGTFSGNVLLTFSIKGDTGATGATGSVSAATSLTFTETAEPSTPSANDLVLYVDSADGLLKQKNDAGVVSEVGAAIGRELLTADRTYYVRTDGSDSNDGLTNSAGGAFLTIQKAIDVTASLDLGIYDVTIQVGNGTYTQALTLKQTIGAGTVFLVGDTTTPSNVTITSATLPTILSTVPSLYDIKGFTINCTDATFKIAISTNNGNISFGNLIFPYFSDGYHIEANGPSAKIEASANYTISGGATIHAISQNGAFITARGKTITLSDSPAFIISFVRATVLGTIDFVSNTYSGSATGVRYTATLNGVVFSNGATLPGNSAGSVATGGQYS